MRHKMTAVHTLSLRVIASALLLAAASVPLVSQTGTDWPQFRGPNRDGQVSSFAEPKAWPDKLIQKWKVEIGTGYATPVLIGDRVYEFTRQGTNEVMLAVDAGTGKVVWQTRYPAPVTVNPAAEAHGPGPKSTPTFASGRLFTLGMGGIVTAFDAASGKMLWQKPAPPKQPLFGTAMSPVVDRGLVIIHVGGHDQGALTAFDAATGTVKWTWNGDGPSYGSPIVADVGGVRQVITLSQDNIVGVSAADGALLWQQPFKTEYTQNSITPILIGQTVLIGGFQRPTAAFRIVKNGAQWRTEEAWQNESVSMYMANAVVVGDALFGLSHRNRGQYFLADVKTGKTLWTGMPRQGENAAILRAGSVIFSLEDDGELIVGRVGPSRFDEVKRYKVSDSATWAQPTIAGNRIFIKDASTLALWTIN